jgi:hypothetical protein
MASNVTAGGNGRNHGVALLPTFSPRAAEFLATPRVIRTTEDGASFEVDGTWALPDEIPETVVAECRRWLASHDAASGYANEGRIKFWLVRLLSGLPGDHSAETVELKMAAFIFALGDKRAFCFDDTTLRLAMKRFKFWPSAAELIEFADDMEIRVRRQAARAQKIADTGARRPGQQGTGGKIDIEASERRMREKQAAENLELAEKLGVKPTEPPPRLPGETDRQWGRRIYEQGLLMAVEGFEAVSKAPTAAPTAAELDAAREAMKPKQPAESTEPEAVS